MFIQNTFGQRAQVLESPEVNIKFFLVFEGEQTEVQYFDGIKENRNLLNINPLIEIKEVKRSFNEKGWSNPKKILDRLLEFMQEGENQSFSLETIINCTIQLLVNDDIINSDSIYSIKQIENTIKTHFESEESITDFNQVCNVNNTIDIITNCLNDFLDLSNVIENIPTYLNSQKIVFDPEIDKVCLIVDRDKHSFVNHENSPQFDYVVEKCGENKIDFYLTNPCFEFWLLLHFDEVHSLDKSILLENPKTRGRKRYAEDELSKIVEGYNKNNIQFDKFLNRIDNAITNQESFESEITELESNVGSNIGNLITLMRNI